MKTIKVSFILLMVIVSAFVMIYVVEGFYEGKTSAPVSLMEETSLPSANSRPVMARLKELFPSANKSESPETAVSSVDEARHDEIAEVHHGLCVAAMTGDTEKTRLLLDAGISANAHDAFGIRAIARATLWGHHDVVELLLKHGAEVNESERLGVSLLMLAANQGDGKLTDLFLKYGADVNLKSDDGETALSTAVKKGFRDIADRLRLAGAREFKPAVIAVPREPIASPARTRLLTGRELMESRKDPKAAPGRSSEKTFKPEPAVPVSFSGVSETGDISTPSLDALTWAASISQDSITVDPETWEKPPVPSEAPARIAVPAASAAARPEPVPDKNPEPVLVFAGLDQEDMELEDILHDLKALKITNPAEVPDIKIPQTTVAENFPESAAVSTNGAPAALKALPSSFKVQTSAAVAASPKPSGHTDAVLREPPERKSVETDPQLLQASLFGVSDQVDQLIRRGVDVNARGELEMTPLMLAAQDGHLQIVKLLLDHGADVNAQNIVGQTALRLASLKEHHDVMLVLRKYGARE